jgi:integrase/DNA-binding protein Fis
MIGRKNSMTEILLKYKEHLLARNKSLIYLNYITLWLDWCEQNKIDYNNISQEIITNFFNSTKYSAGSKNNFIKAGRAFYSFLGNENSEWKKISILAVEEKSPIYITDEELQKGINYLLTIERKMSPIKIEVILNFLFYVGIRRGEFLTLKRSDFDLKENIVNVKIQKTKEEDIRFFTDKVKTLLTTYFNSEQEETNAFNITQNQLLTLLGKLNEIFPGKKITPHKFRHCVSADTQALTRRGWKFYKELRIGEYILTYNFKRNRLEFSKLLNKYIYSFKNKLYHLKFYCIDTLFTKEHKLLLQKRTYKTRPTWKPPELYTIKEIKLPFQYIVSAKIKQIKKYRLGIYKSFILGILMADGNISYSNRKYIKPYRDVTISQSWSANRKKCRIIEKYLKKSKIRYVKHLQGIKQGYFNNNEYQMMVFRIKSSSQNWIFNWLYKNKSPKNTIYNLNRNELQHIFYGLILGDGCQQRYRGIEYRGQEIEMITLLQTISCLLGYRSMLVKDNRGYNRLYICKRNRIEVSTLKNNLKLVNYNGKVWCPQTKNLTFLAKRNNSIFLTGNSFSVDYLSKGGNLAELKDLLGHKNIQTTMRYAKYNKETLKKRYKEVFKKK